MYTQRKDSDLNGGSYKGAWKFSSEREKESQYLIYIVHAKYFKYIFSLLSEKSQQKHSKQVFLPISKMLTGV